MMRYVIYFVSLLRNVARLHVKIGLKRPKTEHLQRTYKFNLIIEYGKKIIYFNDCSDVHCGISKCRYLL